MTQDSQSEKTSTTATSQTTESSVSSIYHEKRATSLEQEDLTQTDDTGVTNFPVRDMYLTGATLHIVTDVNLSEKALTIDLPIKGNGSISHNAFNLPRSNPFRTLIRFLQTHIDHNTQDIRQLASFSGELTTEETQIRISPNDTTNSKYSLTEPLPEDEREPIDPAANALNIILQYYDDGKRGIFTTLQNYHEGSSKQGHFSIDAPITAETTPTFDFDVTNIQLDTDKSPTSRLIETAGQGEPTFLPGSEVILLHINDTKILPESEEYKFISTSTDRNWVLLLPEDHDNWWNEWTENTNTKGEWIDGKTKKTTEPPDKGSLRKDTAPQKAHKHGLRMAFTGTLITVASELVFGNPTTSIEQTIGFITFTSGLAVLGLAGVLLLIYLITMMTPPIRLLTHYMKRRKNEKFLDFTVSA